MIDNRKLIIPLLEFPKPGDTFYFIQILQRKKDNKNNDISNGLFGSNNNSRLIKAYYITKKEDVDKYWEEMVAIANLFKSRISINLNPRSFEKTAYKTISKMAHQMENRDFYNIRRAYNTACGEYQSEIDKRWIVDIDDLDTDNLQNIINNIKNLYSYNLSDKNYKILAILPSKSGYHIICNPFNIPGMTQKSIEIHKNNPTNLYIP